MATGDSSAASNQGAVASVGEASDVGVRPPDALGLRDGPCSTLGFDRESGGARLDRASSCCVSSVLGSSDRAAKVLASGRLDRASTSLGDVPVLGSDRAAKVSASGRLDRTHTVSK